MAYIIRDFEPRDAQALADLTLAAIKSVGAARYSEAQVHAWASRHPGPERFLTRAEAGHLIYIAEDSSGKPAAYALLEPDGHLDMLYCHPEHTRRGLADELLAHAETQARDLGVSKLYTEASELAQPAFTRAGYETKRRRDFEIEGPSGAVSIHNYAMEKPLT